MLSSGSLRTQPTSARAAPPLIIRRWYSTRMLCDEFLVAGRGRVDESFERQPP